MITSASRNNRQVVLARRQRAILEHDWSRAEGGNRARVRSRGNCSRTRSVGRVFTGGFGNRASRASAGRSNTDPCWAVDRRRAHDPVSRPSVSGIVYETNRLIQRWRLGLGSTRRERSHDRELSASVHEPAAGVGVDWRSILHSKGRTTDAKWNK